MTQPATWNLGALDEAEPVNGVAASRMPESDAELAEIFEHIEKLQKRLDASKQYEKDRLDLIRERCGAEQAGIEAQIKFWQDGALAYCHQAKTRIRLPDLNISVEAKPEKGLEWTDEAALLLWALKNEVAAKAEGIELVRYPEAPPKPDKAAIKAWVTLTGEIPEGAKVKDGLRLDVRRIGGSK